MRIVFVMSIAAVATLFGVRASQAYYGDGPWCAVESIGFNTVTENCDMRSFEQCRLQTIAGNRGFCVPNPRWTGGYGFDEHRRRKHKHRVRSH